MIDTLPAPSRILYDGRYELIELLGAGGGGSVWRARDADTGELVAVKRLRVVSTAHRARVRREIAALRMLQKAGVVRLLNVGEVHGEPYIAMELLSGAEFPGRDAHGDWRRVVARAVNLCNALERVHTLGIVHRDLKPANVFVNDDDSVVLLDFGLARGDDLVETVTEVGGVVGTPRYLSPEQALGAPATPAADLYSVGVMLHEALSPTRARDEALPSALLSPRRTFPPLRDGPPALRELVGRLLRVDPKERPRSARAVAEGLALTLGEALTESPGIPFVGREDLLAWLLASLAAGETATVNGGPGSGRTRLLDALADRLVAEGRTVVRLGAGASPYESLQPVGSRGGPGTGNLVREAVVARLSAGEVLLVDDFERCDLWSRRLLESCRELGGMVWVGEIEGGWPLRALTAEELGPIFAGPAHFFHIREDAAALLHMRTRGLPDRLAAELASWEAAGFARWLHGPQGAALELTREGLEEASVWAGRPLHGLGAARAPRLAEPLAQVLAILVLGESMSLIELGEVTGSPLWELALELEELEAQGLVLQRGDGQFEARGVPELLERWPEDQVARVHRTLAGLRADQPERQMRHLLAGGQTRDAILAAERAAEACTHAGRLARARGLLASALREARSAGWADLELRVLGRYAAAALAEASPTAVREALLNAQRCESPGAAPIVALIEAVCEVNAGRQVTAAARIATLDLSDHRELEEEAHAVRLRVLNQLDVQAGEALIESLRERYSHTPERESRWLSWYGLSSYMRGRLTESAESHQAGLAKSRHPFRQLVGSCNLAASLIDTFDPEGGLAAAEGAIELARSLRLPFFERAAFNSLLAARYRLGRPLPPDANARIAASRAIGDGAPHAQLAWYYAADAWRREDLGQARALAGEALNSVLLGGRADLAAIQAALAFSLGHPCASAGQVFDLIRQSRFPRLAAQALALVAYSAPDLAPEARSVAAASGCLNVQVPEDKRLELLEWREVLRYLAASP